jgi:hypothetical protein
VGAGRPYGLELAPEQPEPRRDPVRQASNSVRGLPPRRSIDRAGVALVTGADEWVVDRDPAV